jgi:hypothetical protein
MALRLIASGAPTPLQVLLPGGETNLFPQARIFNSAALQIGAPVDLSHASNGVYFTSGPTLSDGIYSVVYSVFTNSLRTFESPKYGRIEDYFHIQTLSGSGGGGVLTAADVWNYLTSSASVANSIGKRVVDFLDVAVSTRSDSSALAAGFSASAKEATLNSGLGILAAEVNQNEVLLNALTVLATAINSKTQNLPSDPARQSLVDSSFNTVASALGNLGLGLGLVKAKTDNLPSDPASQASVLAIPLNTVLASDPRLSYLDAPVSGAGGGGGIDISGLATRADVENARNLVLDSVENVQVVVDQAALEDLQDRPFIRRIPTFPAEEQDVVASRDAVIARIDLLPEPATASAVWDHPVRTVTQNFPGPDISNLATKDDLAGIGGFTYACKSSTAFNPTTSEHEIIAWVEKNGSLMSTGVGICTVTVKDSFGAEKWSSTLPGPNADGIYRFSNTLYVTQSQNYYVIVQAVADASIRTSVDSFYTII